MNGQMIYNILRDYKMLNCEVLVRDEDGAYIHPLLADISKKKKILTYKSHC